ncbi:MAG: isochorismate synthase [Marinagarivorans sp.]|nr:isochorismate synthase [Marinagarivorans sp.]
MSITLNFENTAAIDTDNPGSFNNLLDGYQPHHDVYFCSEENTLLAHEPFAALLVGEQKNIAAQVAESLRFASELGLKNSVVIGAIPFDVEEKAYLRVSPNYSRLHFKEPPSNHEETLDLGDYRVREVPEPQIFMAGVKDALARFARGELEKVVLSRTLEVDCDGAPNVRAMVKKLARKNARGYTFAVDLNIPGEAKDKRTLIGSSPELLISRRGNKVFAHPLAGSEPRSQDPIIDKTNANALLASSKDRYEHALVVSAIAKKLAPFCKTLRVPEAPSLLSTATMWHLGSAIDGELINGNTSSIELALAMHPTPAVGGYPTHKAQAAIKEIETHKRDLFAGMVGWCDASGDGEWAVTIRCAEVKNNKITLYAGAGIVTGSTPEKELAETGAKFNTLLHALGVSLQGEIHGH